MMRGIVAWVLTWIVIGGTVGVVTAEAEPWDELRSILPFDHDWRFLKSDTTGAEKPGFADATWRKLNVPHDWSIEGPFDEKNPAAGAGGFLPAGSGWYRKHFTLPETDAIRRVFIQFDGVMANSDVWINGVHLGRRPNGYVSFEYELAGHLNFGDAKPNVLAVRADNAQQPASRWYAGAGIYRHVRLVVTDPIHFEHWGTFVSTPKVEAGQATVRVDASVVNQSSAPRDVAVQVTLFGPDGKPVQSAKTAAQAVAPGRLADFRQVLSVDHPQIWDLAHPNLYRAVTRVVADDRVLDGETTPFGIRQFEFKPDTGFWLNGKNFKIKGVFLHGDASALGVAVPLGAWERRLNILKQLGVNAIRTAHNPPDPEFLDLCDRMGFLVMDELFDCWTVGKNKYDYHFYFDEWSKTDTRDTIRRDRNHPSIILYSAGNEIHDTPKAELAKRILGSLVEVIHANDPTRPVTQALFRPNVSHDYDDGLADMLDVIGQNYRENEILAAHRQKPTRKIIGTENGMTLAAWLALRDNPPYAGQFLWAGIDYLGESRHWPIIDNNQGLLDRTDEPRPIAFQRESWWSDQPMVHITRRIARAEAAIIDPGYGNDPLRRPQVLFSDWTPHNRAAHEETVEVYSNCEQVELVLNGKSLGSKPRPADDAPRVWQVPFQPGTLKAVGSNYGQTVATDELRTAGKPAKILLTTDHDHLTPDWNDVSYVTATVTDADGVPVPDAHDEISFAIEGPGVIAAVDSADGASHEPFQASQRRAYQGRCVALLKATAAPGPITLTATAPDLVRGSITVETTAR
ncbi:MAG TPA: glycoside hydrolase family 2 TIM barrel-domain containing protein [Tepidisphaeraceae bacterium]|jgi:beta-galactosidase